MTQEYDLLSDCRKVRENLLLIQHRQNEEDFCAIIQNWFSYFGEYVKIHNLKDHIEYDGVVYNSTISGRIYTKDDLSSLMIYLVHQYYMYNGGSKRIVSSFVNAMHDLEGA